MSEALIHIKDLSWYQDNKAILQNINLTIQAGEFVAIIGPNGAGKTSLLKCIDNQIQAEGDVFFKQKKITEFQRKILARSITMVSQSHLPIFSLSVYEVVRMGLVPHKHLFALDSKQDKKNILNAIEQVGLTAFMYKNFETLSGGEQQRALIAQALVQGAELMLMDEPTNHLDVHYQHQVMQLVKGLNNTVIMTVHDLNLAAHYCDRLILMDKGEILLQGNAEQVLQQELLAEVFQLNCHQYQHEKTGLPRVSFSLNES